MASILKVDTIQDQSGNNIINESGDTITIGASGDTITVPTGASLTVPNGGLSGQNYPAFEAYLSASQTVSDAVITKAQIDTEVLDTNSYYDNSTNYRFTPLIAGKYLVYGSVYTRTATNSALDFGLSYIYKNGTVYREQITQFTSNRGRQASVYVTAIIDMNGSTDYVELFGNTNVSAGTPEFSSSNKGTYFGAYRIGD